MSLASLFIAALLPVVKVGVLCSVGALAAKRNLLTLDGRRVLSALIFNIFVPCQFLDKLSTVSFVDAVHLWPITFNMVVAHGVGFLLGCALLVVLRPPQALRGHLLAANTIGNTGNLPLVLAASLGADPSLAWLGGTAVGERYIMLGNITAAFIQFPVIQALLRRPSVAPDDAAAEEAKPLLLQQPAQVKLGSIEDGAEEERGGRVIQNGAPPLRQALSLQMSAEIGAGKAARSGPPPLTQIVVLDHEEVGAGDATSSVPGLPPGAEEALLLQGKKEAAGLSPPGSSLEGRNSAGSSGASNDNSPAGSSPLARIVAALQRVRQMLSGALAPPTIACLLALAIASVPPVQAAIYAPGGALRFIGEAIRMFSAMAIPSLMLGLGANLSIGPGVSDIPLRLVVGTIVSRMLIMPLLGTGFVMGMNAVGLLSNIEPFGKIVMLLTFATPTAIVVHSMATLYRNREDDLAALLFWEYLSTALALPFVLAFFLRISS